MVRTAALLGTIPQLPNGEKESEVQSCLGEKKPQTKKPHI